MLLHIRRFTIAQLDELGARFLAATAASQSASATAASAALGQSQAWPSCCAFAVPLAPLLYLLTLLRFHSFVCFALCLGFRLILAHFPIRLQPFAFCRFPFIPFSCSLSRSLPFSLLVFHCSRIRFCWPEPNERMTKTNSPQSELFYGQTICMLVCPRLSLSLCVLCGMCHMLCVCVIVSMFALICNAMNASTLLALTRSRHPTPSAAASAATRQRDRATAAAQISHSWLFDN